MIKKKINLRDIKAHEHSDSDGHDHGHDHGHSHGNGESGFKQYIPAIISFVLLIGGIALDYFDAAFFTGWVRIVWYVLAYVPVGFPVMKQGWVSIMRGDFFTEFFFDSLTEILFY